MRIAKFFRLPVLGCVALLAASAPGFAQNAAQNAAPGNDHFAVQLIAATASKRATNLQRAPIALTFLNVVALEDRAAQGARTAIAASSLSRPNQN